MALPKFLKKKQEENPLENGIIANIIKGVNVENAIITFFLLQAQENNISLAKKDDATFIYINSKKINDFLGEWYTLLQLHQKKKLGKKMYDIFIKSQLEENKLTEDTEDKKKDDIGEII